jgi:DNA repair protein RadC
MKIKLLSKIDLPREKLQKYGVAKLANYELLAILLGSGIAEVNVLQLAKQILQTIAKIGKEKMTIENLCEIKGLGQAKAAQIIAVIELAKRLSVGAPEIMSAEDVWQLCVDIRDSKREHLVAFYLDTQNRLIERQIIFIGTLNASIVHPREIFEPAIRHSAAAIIVAHNHPSGDLEPSPEDKETTTRLVEAGKILGVDLIDHIIVSRSAFMSFEERHLL